MSVLTKQTNNTHLQPIDGKLITVPATQHTVPVLEVSKEMSMRDIFGILQRRKFTILLTLLSVLALALLYTFSTPPTYRANAMIQIEREGAEIVNFGRTQKPTNSPDS